MQATIRSQQSVTTFWSQRYESIADHWEYFSDERAACSTVSFRKKPDHVHYKVDDLRWSTAQHLDEVRTLACG